MLLLCLILHCRIDFNKGLVKIRAKLFTNTFSLKVKVGAYFWLFS